MRTRRRTWGWLAIAACALTAGTGCATMRANHAEPDLRPCSAGFAHTADGWNLGVRRYPPARPDPGKLPVVLCHGLGLNGTFWTITGGDHLARQLAARGYDVFVVDMRGSGGSYRDGRLGRVNRLLRQTPLNELGEWRWTMDDEAFYDVPAILDHVRDATGSARVNWVGHSLGGMLMFAFLEHGREPWRVANFVDMGGVAHVADSPERIRMLRANRQLRVLLTLVSTGRLARPMMFARLPGLENIDRFYYTAANVDDRTVDRFYGFTLENPGRGALRQLDAYLDGGRLLSADGRRDYAADLGRIATPTLMVAGEGDIIADIPSTYLTFNALGSPDKTLLRFGRAFGHVDDYGHCDLVWSRHAPREIFPAVADWLDRRQPGALASPQAAPTPQSAPAPQHARAAPPPAGASAVAQQPRVDADLRPALETVPPRAYLPEPEELGIGQP